MSGDVDMTTINSMSDAAQKDIISVKYYIESNVLPVYGLQSWDTSTSTISFQWTIPYTRVSEEGFLISFLDEDSTVLLSYYWKVNWTDNDNTKKAWVFDYNTTITFTNKDVALQDVVYIKIRSSNNPKRPTNQYDMIYTEK